MYRNDKCRRCDASCSSSPTKCVECDLACYCRSKCQADDRWRHEADCEMAKLVRKCSGCGVRKVAMQQCGSCLEVWYCSKACQKRHWPRHKHECLRISQEIVELTNAMIESWSYRSGIPYVYYWGNMPAVDLINLSLNEGSGYASPLSLLLCGVGDPRNVALSLASLPESYQEQLIFVLNDITVCTLARTVLLLYMLWEGGEQAPQTVTQVWYSLRITDHVHSLLTSTLQRLVQATSLEELTRGLMGATNEHFKSLKRVWQKWLELSSTDGTWITEQRRRVFARDPGAQTGISNYLSEIPSEHKSSAKEWLDNGILLSKKQSKKARRENITLTGSCGEADDDDDDDDDDEFTYCLSSDSLPFTSWDYKDAKAFHNVPSLLEMYSGYVSHVLAKCASRLISGKVKLHFILSNCLKMQPFVPEGLAFDRVLTSNLCDYMPLPALLEMCKPLLNKANPSSVIVTETLNWFEHFPEIQSKIIMDFSSGVHKERASRDTGNQAIATSSCRTSFTEYYNLNDEFQKFVRAALLLSEIDDLTRGKSTPSLKALALKHGLILRNYLRNGNRIFPFRWPINCRRVTQLNGFERAVEWVLPADQ